MTWTVAMRGLGPALVKQWADYAIANPLPKGHEAQVRNKVKELIEEVRKGTADDREIDLVAFGSATLVDGKEVAQSISVTFTAVAPEA